MGLGGDSRCGAIAFTAANSFHHMTKGEFGIQKRQLGNQGLCVSSLGLGCMGMSEFCGSTDDEQSISTVHRALDLGVDFPETADMYGMGHNEELAGRAVRDCRDKVVPATKFGVVRGSDGSLTRIVKGSPKHVRQACEAGLKRLGVETIDLCYQHRVDTRIHP